MSTPERSRTFDRNNNDIMIMYRKPEKLKGELSTASLKFLFVTKDM